MKGTVNSMTGNSRNQKIKLGLIKIKAPEFPTGAFIGRFH